MGVKDLYYSHFVSGRAFALNKYASKGVEKQPDLKTLYTPPIKQVHLPSRNPFCNGKITDHMSLPLVSLGTADSKRKKFVEDMSEITLLSPHSVEPSTRVMTTIQRSDKQPPSLRLRNKKLQA